MSAAGSVAGSGVGDQGDGQDAIRLEGNNPPGTYVLQDDKPKKKEVPQQSMTNFWKRFNTKHPGKAYSVLPDNLYAKRMALHATKEAASGQRAATSYDEAAASCKRKVDKIVKECRRVNQKYRDVHFDLEFDLKWGTRNTLDGLDEDTKYKHNPGSVKRVDDVFEKPRFWIDGVSSGDVRQGRDGDCWFLAALCTLSNVKNLIEKVCVARDEQVGVYGFVFHRDGEWISTIIDDKLFLIREDYDEGIWDRMMFDDGRQRADDEDEYRRLFQTGSGALYFAQCSDPNETWLPLLEKAYAKAHGDYTAIEGGWCGEGLEDLTGGVTHELFGTDILDKDKFWTDELMKVNEEFLFGCGTGLFGGWGERKGIVEGHAYSIMRAVEIDGERLLLLRNPWGKGEWNGPWSDGSKEWTAEWMQKLNHVFGDDGAFWISYRDMLRKYQHFERTRLFGPEWRVTQQWTTVHVPWATEYLSTKFKVTVEKPGHIVFSLSQLDDRYFRGLEGRYNFSLQFRLHKDGEKDYIVRSNQRYCGNRSCSTELDLEAGTYWIVFKVMATKIKSAKAAEDVVQNTCTNQREKLLQIGFSYDMAHAKGSFVESLREKTEREAKEEKKKQLDEAKAKKKREEARVKLTKKKIEYWQGQARYQVWSETMQTQALKAANLAAGISAPGPEGDEAPAPPQGSDGSSRSEEGAVPPPPPEEGAVPPPAPEVSTGEGETKAVADGEAPATEAGTETAAKEDDKTKETPAEAGKVEQKPIPVVEVGKPVAAPATDSTLKAREPAAKDDKKDSEAGSAPTITTTTKEADAPKDAAATETAASAPVAIAKEPEIVKDDKKSDVPIKAEEKSTTVPAAKEPVASSSVAAPETAAATKEVDASTVTTKESDVTTKDEKTAPSASTDSTAGGAGQILTPETSTVAPTTGGGEPAPAPEGGEAAAAPQPSGSVEDFDFADSMYSVCFEDDPFTNLTKEAAGQKPDPAPGTVDDDDDAAAAATVEEDIDDDFTKDPWNAVCVVGLRVFSKEGLVTVEVVTPPKKEDEDDDGHESEEEVLDEDAQGKDAVKGIEGAEDDKVEELEKTKESKLEKQEVAKDVIAGKEEETEKKEDDEKKAEPKVEAGTLTEGAEA